MPQGYTQAKAALIGLFVFQAKNHLLMRADLVAQAWDDGV